MGRQGSKLKLVGGKRPILRGRRRNDFTVAMAERFVEVLAETCNVTLATQAIGRSISNVYRQREKDATFRGRWDAALRIGYSKLELMLLERALHGVEKRIKAGDGSEKVMREYPDRVALTLLRMHRDTVIHGDAQSADTQEHEEARARIEARLERLRRRDGIVQALDVETKGANVDLTRLVRMRMGRMRLIGWGLARGRARR